MNVVLCGMMGVGKSTVGMKIAGLMKRHWVDTDTLIENRHGTINDIFEYYGEAHFRMLESQITEELAGEDELVISTGGGLVLKSENAELLKKSGKLFFLSASVETLLARVQGDDTRPLLKDVNARERLTQLLQERTPRYEHASDYKIETDGKSADEVAREIVAIMERL